MKNTALLASFFLFACSNSNVKDAEFIDRPTREIERASWLIGEWHTEIGGVKGIESWEKVNDSIYAGRSYFMRGDDTVSTESIKLEQHNDALFYIPLVKNQNQGLPVSFKLISSDSNKLTFSNPAHDFPQMIQYQQLSNDSLVAQISGTVNGEYRSRKFPMRRVN